jgi:hypothetical protein
MALDFSKIADEIVGYETVPLELGVLAKPITFFVPPERVPIMFKDFIPPYLEGANTYEEVCDKLIKESAQGIMGDAPNRISKAIRLIEGIIYK